MKSLKFVHERLWIEHRMPRIFRHASRIALAAFSVILGAALFIALLPALPVEAQDGRGFSVDGDPASPALAIVQTYLAERDPAYLADDVSYYDPLIAQPVGDMDELNEWDGLFSGDAFSDVYVDPQHYVVAEDTVVAEFHYSAINTGEYQDQGATDLSVEMRVVGIFDVDVSNSEIDAARFFYDTGWLHYQLGYVTALNYGMVGGRYRDSVTYEETVLDVDDIVEDEQVELGETVTVEGEVSEWVGETAVDIRDMDWIDLDPEHMLLIPRSPDGFMIDLEEDDDIIATGTVYRMDIDDLEVELGYDLDNEVFEDYFGWWVLLVEPGAVEK